MVNRSDVELVNQCLGGNNKAYDLLVKRYELQMYRTAFGIVKDPDLAKDVTQNGFLKSWEKLHSFNPNLKYYSWLYRIIVNEALNTVRRKKKFGKLTLMQSDEDNPQQKLMKKEQSNSLMKVIESLPVDYNIVLQLRHFEELSYQEISEILEIEIKTVKSRLYTARMHLREKLYDRQGDL